MQTALMLFGNDLRLGDNPALYHASQECEYVLPVYVDTADDAGEWFPGEASRWWFHRSLQDLASQLKNAGSRLVIRRGPLDVAVTELYQQVRFDAVYYNRRYEPWFVPVEKQLQQWAEANGVTVVCCNGSLLHEPEKLLNNSGKPYRVYTPFMRRLDAMTLDVLPLPAPQLKSRRWKIARGKVEDLDLLPQQDWYRKLDICWQPGETAARSVVARLFTDGFENYAANRDIPSVNGTSRLSPYLRTGEISPRELLYRLQQFKTSADPSLKSDTDSFVRELVWREFSYYILAHFPAVVHKPLNEKYRGFRYRRNTSKLLKAWEQGRTGIPLVDAGMRELWETGYMHNRVRMITASWLTRNSLISWRQGARWFQDTLIDADLAINSFNWQWVAGCGADAAPYFRIFNPVTQAKKFDPDATYIRRWIPELADMAVGKILALGQGAVPPEMPEGYPVPVLDPGSSRETALQHFRDQLAAATV